MANESTGRARLAKLMRDELGLHAHAVESGDTRPGIPDIEYCGRGVGQGWLEVKRLNAWPKRESTPIRLPKGYLKRAQVTFMKHRLRAGGTCGLALQVEGRDWFLIDPGVVLRGYDRAQELLVLDPYWLRETAVRLSSTAGLNGPIAYSALEWLRIRCYQEAKRFTTPRGRGQPSH